MLFSSCGSEFYSYKVPKSDASSGGKYVLLCSVILLSPQIQTPMKGNVVCWPGRRMDECDGECCLSFFAICPLMSRSHTYQTPLSFPSAVVLFACVPKLCGSLQSGRGLTQKGKSRFTCDVEQMATLKIPIINHKKNP
eukprot:scaffold2069_cov187-Amphora_coffeaeformis.AAC.34